MKNNVIGIIAFVLIVAFFGSPFYVVYEGQQAVITMFGKPRGNVVTNAGLKFKVPFFEKVHKFEKRILEWDGYATEIPTKDKRFIFIDTTARWRIKDPLVFFKSVQNEKIAQSRLDGIIDAAVRDVVMSNNLIEIVRSSNRVLDTSEFSDTDKIFMDEGALEEITVGRDKMRDAIIKIAKELVPQYGIEIIDVRVKRINYLEKDRQSVYQRMIAERNREAEKYRSEGRGIKAEVEGKTDKELKVILSEAYRQAEEIKGAADAESTEIYAESFGKDPEFYSFVQTLESYVTTLNKDTSVIISTKGDYFKYLNSRNEN
ncbi:MAG: protease modulator HflC [Candidatus Omnitrophica bacterium]|nr:protease modulator HflC [Candidatus Omnitrophota bacterium]MDD5440783.1 protease modulator HflC [Candidatus Omnitrophota bacterium]